MPPHRWQSCVDGQVHKWSPRVSVGAFNTEAGTSATSATATRKPYGSEETQERTMRAVAFPNVAVRSNFSHVSVDNTDSASGSSSSSLSGENRAYTSDSQKDHAMAIRSEYNSSSNSSTSSSNTGSGSSNSNSSGNSTSIFRGVSTYEEEKGMIQRYMADRRMEIFAILEGTDSTTGGPCQARHSFLCSEIEWDRTFAPCVSEDENDGAAVIDFSVFHDLIDVSINASYCGSSVSSQS